MKQQLLFILTAALGATVVAPSAAAADSAPLAVSFELAEKFTFEDDEEEDEDSGLEDGQSRHELSVYGGGGLSMLRYRSAVGSSRWGLGGQAGLGYAYRFHRHWEVLAGAGVALYRATVGINGVELTTAGLRDRDGDLFDLHSTLSGHSEAQQAILLNVPLLARFGVGVFYAQAGVTVGIPLQARYRTAAFTVAHRGWYPDHGSWSAPQQNEALGLGTFEGAASSGALSLRVSVSASLEAGLRYRIASRWMLYTGVYCDYGLTNSGGGAEASDALVPYRTPYAASSVLHARQTAGTLAPLALGVAVRIGFGSAPVRKVDELAMLMSGARDTIYIIDTLMLTNTLVRIDTVLAFAPKRKAEKKKKKNEKGKKADNSRRSVSPAAVAPQKGAKNLLVTIDDYSYGYTELPIGAAQQLAPVVEVLKADPAARVVVEGHTCNWGTPAINAQLGQLRAHTVAQYLIKQGISSRRVKSAGKADTSPRVPNTSEQNRRINRRVEVRLVRDK
jgi:outer membrane protein OmpA-like peptidoglycan-associated protein